MTDSFRTTPPEQQWSGDNRSANGYQGPDAPNAQSSYENSDDSSGDIGKTVLVGLLGGLLSAAGFMIYRRLPDEQKEKLHHQVRTQVQQRINDIRSNFNI